MQNTKTQTAKRLRWGVLAVAFGVALFWAASVAERFIMAAHFADATGTVAPAASTPAGPHANSKPSGSQGA